MPKVLPNLHPIFVHFTIALFFTSFGLLILGCLVTKWKKLKLELFVVSRWCLWLSAIITIATVASGFYAYYTVIHDSITHSVMQIHRNWALVTFFVIEFMGIWLLVLYFKKKRVNGVFFSGVSIGFLLVMVTGWYGSELVYRYGTGVLSLPQEHSIEHPHHTNSEIIPPKFKN